MQRTPGGGFTSLCSMKTSNSCCSLCLWSFTTGSLVLQEAGITRLGGLLAEAEGTGSALPSSCGLTPSAMCPVVMEAVCLGAGLGLLGVRFG